MATENLFDAFAQLEASTSRLGRIVFDDPDTHAPGLLSRIEGLNVQLTAVSADLQTIKRRRPNLALWGTGYVAFLVSGAFAMAAFQGMPEVRALLDLPAPVAAGLALVFAVAALLLFAGGFGWLDRTP